MFPSLTRVCPVPDKARVVLVVLNELEVNELGTQLEILIEGAPRDTVQNI